MRDASGRSMARSPARASPATTRPVDAAPELGSDAATPPKDVAAESAAPRAVATPPAHPVHASLGRLRRAFFALAIATLLAALDASVLLAPRFDPGSLATERVGMVATQPLAALAGAGLVAFALAALCFVLLARPVQRALPGAPARHALGFAWPLAGLLLLIALTGLCRGGGHGQHLAGTVDAILRDATLAAAAEGGAARWATFFAELGGHGPRTALAEWVRFEWSQWTLYAVLFQSALGGLALALYPAAHRAAFGARTLAALMGAMLVLIACAPGLGLANAVLDAQVVAHPGLSPLRYFLAFGPVAFTLFAGEYLLLLRNAIERFFSPLAPPPERDG